MSQIPRSQFGLKKRQGPVPLVSMNTAEHHNGSKAEKQQTNGSSKGNGHKIASYENDVVIIEDDCFAVVGHEEVIASTLMEEIVEDVSPKKKKRGRKSKDSTESKDSEILKKSFEEAFVSKSPSEKGNRSKQSLNDYVASSETKVENSSIDETSSKIEKETKIVKLTTTEDIQSLSSKRRSDRLQNASTIVNLSTVSSSDQSTKVSDETLESTPILSERRVIGRRSTRPIDDIKFTYRTPNPDYSFNATTNATVGSDMNNDSMITTPGTDRKRRPITDSMENLESPKRSRLEFSGLFNSFSSPITLLRNRFKRTNIASTPVVDGEAALLDDSVDSLNASGDMKEIDLNEKHKEIADDQEKEEDEEELKIITTPIKKRACVIM
ncbi:CLUMA_CG005529, isoform A [Clunio marinus]|uniref:CLUMA_CG005529, isoform A n=1 Tax=Clunio marinus TaxID=568069 RepID=A0A1J1HV64_9DIPT|nr:CLUMA_CG005529, isoform A [Clunio marinus]